jgi:glycosyltransferase involved in cell wall biosynthesis
MATKRKKNSQHQQKRKPTFEMPVPQNPGIDYSIEPATVALSIIVKNESKVIERMLNTVWPLLDYYCVIDTGSTDGTQDIVRKFFEDKGIPGEVIDHPWKNFEDARNKAKDSIKGKADFGFWIDADEQLIINDNFNIDIFKRSLNKVDGGNVKIFYGGQNYFRMQFYKTNINWYWYGPVHEVLICDTPTNIGAVEGLHILVTPDGNSWTSESQEQKYLSHAKILEDYVANDPKKDPRWLFYLAQSYRDTGTHEGREKAIEWYTKRRDITNVGYWEECYFSSLMVAQLKAANKYPEQEWIAEYLSCGKYNKYRAEHLLPLILYYQSKKEYDIAYMYGLRAMQMSGKSPFPQSTLFIDEQTYTWRIYDLHTISCWYSGRKEESTQTYKLLEQQISKGVVPQNQVARLLGNKKYFTDGTQTKQRSIGKSMV